MFNIIFNICQYVLPIVGIIGLFIDNKIMMITAVTFSIFQSLYGYYTGQLKPGAAHIILFLILGLFISYMFNLAWYKGLTITFVFGNIITIIFGMILMMISLISKRKS